MVIWSWAAQDAMVDVKLAWVRQTPLGRPVDPDVYMMRARSLPTGATLSRSPSLLVAISVSRVVILGPFSHCKAVHSFAFGNGLFSCPAGASVSLPSAPGSPTTTVGTNAFPMRTTCWIESHCLI